MVVNELRSESVQNRFMQLFTATHTMKKVPHAKMDPQFQHPNIMIYLLKKRKPSGVGGASGAADPEDADEDGGADCITPEAASSSNSSSAAAVSAAAAAAADSEATVAASASSAAVEGVTEQLRSHSVCEPSVDGSSLMGGGGSSSSTLPSASASHPQAGASDASRGALPGMEDEQQSSAAATAAGLSASPTLLKVLTGQSEGTAWEARRAGFEAARMMGTVSVPGVESSSKV